MFCEVRLNNKLLLFIFVMIFMGIWRQIQTYLFIKKRDPDAPDAASMEGFGTRAHGAAFPIDIMVKSELARMRALLLGEPRFLSG